MRKKIINDANLIIEKGDITKSETDAIVNAANGSLMGGGGVDGAIHRAAGPGLLEECKKLNGCDTGDAKITSGYNLPAKFVIHTVGPIWRGGDKNETNLLASCYRKSIEIALNKGLKTIVFPNISTGVYGFPKEKAAKIAITEVKKFINSNITKIIFVVFDTDNYQIYKEMLYTDGNKE